MSDWEADAEWAAVEAAKAVQRARMIAPDLADMDVGDCAILLRCIQQSILVAHQSGFEDGLRKDEPASPA